MGPRTTVLRSAPFAISAFLEAIPSIPLSSDPNECVPPPFRGGGSETTAPPTAPARGFRDGGSWGSRWDPCPGCPEGRREGGALGPAAGAPEGARRRGTPGHARQHPHPRRPLSRADRAVPLRPRRVEAGGVCWRGGGLAPPLKRRPPRKNSRSSCGRGHREGRRHAGTSDGLCPCSPHRAVPAPHSPVCPRIHPASPIRPHAPPGGGPTPFPPFLPSSVVRSVLAMGWVALGNALAPGGGPSLTPA